MECQHLNGEKLYKWAKDLVDIKGAATQRRLLEYALENDHARFVDHVEISIANTGSGPNSPYLPSQGEIPSLTNSANKPVITMTPGHMYLMPADQILALYKHWQGISYADAACPSLWGAITLSEIRAQRIPPVWLAVHKKCSEDAARMDLEGALKSGDPIKIDVMVRRILRWLAGPGCLRGAVELYENCSLAKAWWCGCLSCQCALILEKEDQEVAQSLKTIWIGFAEFLAGKLTVFAEPNLVSGVALWVNSRGEALPRRTDTERMIKKLGEITSWNALGFASPAEVCRVALELDSQPQS